MNYAGNFDFGLPGNPFSIDESTGVITTPTAADGSAIVIEDAQLLFGGDYARRGSDLVLSKDGHDHVIADYFKGAQRKALSSSDGAMLSPDLVKTLVGEVQVAQAGGATAGAAQVIGTVSKLAGSATAIRNGVSVMLNVGDAVQKGDVVQAGADSSLNLTFIDGTVFGLSANARMVLNEMVYDPQGSANSSLLSLIQGTITFVAGETAKNGDMRVDTPVATMGIRGTAVLVEIGFEVPGQGSAPPVKFQVLVEPNGRTGSYVLYNKNTGAIMGTVNQAGQVTSITGGGDLSVGTAEPLSSIAQSIIQQTLQQYFPSYVPNANPRSGGGGGSTPSDPNSGISPEPLKFAPPPEPFPGQSFQVPINLPGSDINTPPINVTITRFNSAPTVTVTPVVVVLPQDQTSFDIGKQVTVTDPDVDDAATPYVPGSARIISANGPTGTPPSLDMKSLVAVDPQTGHVSYDPAAFKFLAAGQKAVYVIEFDSRSGPDTTHQTLTFTVDGSNDAPVVAAALTGAATQGQAVQSFDLLAGASDPDLGETATLTIGSVKYTLNGTLLPNGAPVGVTLLGTVLHVDPTAFAYLGAGQTATLVVSYAVSDPHGATVTQRETITVTGTNDAPVVTGALTGAVVQTDVAHSFDLLAGASDADLGETATLTIGTVNYALNGHLLTNGAPTGVTLTGHALHVTPSAFAYLGAGQIATLIVSYMVIDAHGASVAQTQTITLTGTNDAPVVTGALTGAVVQTDVARSFDLLAGASDADLGETATLTIGTVNYALNGNLLTNGAPTGVTLTGHTLHVTPSAFAYLGAGQTATLVVSYIIIDAQGASVAQTQTITITGTNDGPVIDADNTTATATATLGSEGVAAQGSIAFGDADLGDIHAADAIPAEGAIGLLTLSITESNGSNADGSVAWTYHGDPAAIAAALIASESGSIDEIFTVTIDDGHGGSIQQTVIVTIAANVWTGSSLGEFRFTSETALQNNWSSSDNWSLGKPPSGTQFVLFNSDATINLDVAARVGALLIGDGVDVLLTASGNGRTLDVAGDVVNHGDVTLAPGVTLRVGGDIHNYGQLTIDHHTAGATLLIDGHVELDGGGTVTLDGSADRITGETHKSTLTNVDNKIDGYGKIGDGHLTLVNMAGGIIAATDFWHGITINTGQGTFTNDGLIVSASLFGGLRIQGDLVNNGTIEARKGVLDIDGDVTGGSGPHHGGHAVIDGGVLKFGGASNSSVLFSGNSADLLVLEDPWHFTGTVTGFSFGDTIDLEGVSWWNVRLIDKGDWLQVKFGAYSFRIDGDYDASHFLITTDFHGGTVITWLDQAPQIETHDLHVTQHGQTTTITGLSMVDDDAGRRETFSYEIVANGRATEHGTGKIGTINAELSHGFSYTARNGETVGKVAVTVTDSHGASDTVNFIFGTANASATTSLALNGTAGKDILIATSHTDTLTGGASADQFVFQTKSGQHVITDFAIGQDKIELDFAPRSNSGFQQWLASHAQQQGADTLITFGHHGGDGTLLLKHVDVADLKAGDFIHGGGHLLV